MESSELSQSAVSYHLGKLEHAGIFAKKKSGTRNCYHLNCDLINPIELLKEEDEG